MAHLPTQSPHMYPNLHFIETRQPANPGQPSSLWPLEDFEINILPRHRSVHALACKVTVSQIAQIRANEELRPSDIRFQLLWEYLVDRQLVTESSFESLTYRTQDTDEPFGILNDLDLQNGVKHFRNRGMGSLTIALLDQDHLREFADYGYGTQSQLEATGTVGSIPLSAAALATLTGANTIPLPSTDRRSQTKLAASKHTRDLSTSSTKEEKEDSQAVSVRKRRRSHGKHNPIVLDSGDSTDSLLPSLISEMENDLEAMNETEQPNRNVSEFDGEGSQPDVEQGIVEATDSQLCEHVHDDRWPQAAAFLKIPNPEKSTEKSTVLIPGMKKEIYHWQWLCVYIIIKFNRGTDGRFGCLVGDEMGLGKTFEGIAAAVFRFQLWNRLQVIRNDRKDITPTPRHCSEKAPLGTKCPSNDWFATCPCEPGSECYNLETINGPTIFFVPPANVGAWFEHLKDLVDFQALGLELTVAHSLNTGLQYTLTTARINQIKTFRDPNHDPPKGKPSTLTTRYGYPDRASTHHWILTTWQTWTKIKEVHETHNYKITVKKKKEVISQDIDRFHCGFAIVDESHMVKNTGKGPWGILSNMKQCRSHLRFWFVAMSGTMISTDPTDIIAPIDIISDKSWSNPNHRYYDFRPASIFAMTKTIQKYRDNKSDPNFQELATNAIQRFGQLLPNFLIRRHDESRWHGKPLVELKKLHHYTLRTEFPTVYKGAYLTAVQKWQATSLAQLKDKQDQWDKQKHIPGYLKNHPQRPTTLSSGSVFNTARLLRLCSNLPHLADASHQYSRKWTNATAESECMDPRNGTIKQGCSLDKEYTRLAATAPKLEAIAMLLPKHTGANVLIMSSFTEMTLVVERYIRQHPDLQRHTRMMYGDLKKRKEAEYALMRTTDPNTGKLLVNDEPDCLIGTIGIMGTGHNLTRATVVILCEPLYHPTEYRQAPKRAHRLGQRHEVFCYVLRSDTQIEAYVDEKRKSKSGFGVEAFQTVGNAIEGGSMVSGGGHVVSGKNGDNAAA